MGRFVRISETEENNWRLDEVEAALLARQAVSRSPGPRTADEDEAPAVILHPEDFPIFDEVPERDELCPEHWVIIGIWLMTILLSAWRLLL